MRPPEVCKRELREMRECLLHEPNYVTGICCEDELGVYAAWTAHAESYADCMPVTSDDGTTTLIFSGDHYGRKGESRSARSLGVGLTGDLARWLRDLNGWFSGIVIDRTRKRSTLFIDRFGLWRIYWHATPEAFYFSTDAKAILQVVPETRQLDETGLAEYFATDTPLQGRSLFKEISLLPGAAAWTFGPRNCLPTKTSYFDIREWEEQEPLEWGAFSGNLDEVFSAILPSYFEGRQETSISITGGLDSRMILAGLPPGNEDKSLNCFTFGGMERETYDVKIARRLARLCNQRYRLYPLQDDFLRDFPRHAEKTIRVAEGGHDAFGSHDIYFNERAKDLAPVRMSGKFGSEIVRLSRHLKYSPVDLELFAPDFRRKVEAVKDTMDSLAKQNPVTYAACMEIPWREYGRLAIEMSQLSFGSPYTDNQLVALMYRGFRSTSNLDDIPISFIRNNMPRLLRLQTDRGYPASRLPGIRRLSDLYYWRLLFKADYLFKYMPEQYRGPGRLCERLGVNKLFEGRHILTSYRKWLCGPLRDYVTDTLGSQEACARVHIDGKRLKTMLSEHANGVRCHLVEINKALTIELLHRLLLESKGSRMRSQGLVTEISTNTTKSGSE